MLAIQLKSRNIKSMSRVHGKTKVQTQAPASTKFAKLAAI